MAELIFYIFKTALCLCVLYIFVKAFLSNDTFHHLNRVVILGGIVICFIISGIEIHLAEKTFVHAPIDEIRSTILVHPLDSEPMGTASTEVLYDAGQTGANEINTSPLIDSNNWLLLLCIIYIGGIVINTIVLLRSYLSMRRIIKGAYKKVYGKITFAISPAHIVPFSWKKYIVISQQDLEEDAQEIVTHEMAHINHKHTYDNLFMELLVLVQWFNPAAWLLKKELKDIHEYQADIQVLESGINATKYQLLLVKKAVGASSYTLANSFNHSKIKKRITMMLKEKSKKRAVLKPLLLVPMCIFALYAFANTGTISKTIENLSGSEVTNITPNSEIVMQDNGETYFFPLPTIKRIAAGYGKKGSRLHSGYDMTGSGNDTIYAMANGMVAHSDYDDNWGNSVTLKHDNNLESIYAHNSVNLVKKGDQVKRGQPIAIIGNSGKTTGTHLHFGVKKNGESINALSQFKFYSKRSLEGIVPPPPPSLSGGDSKVSRGDTPPPPPPIPGKKSGVRKGDTAPPPPPLPSKKSDVRKGDTAPPPPPFPSGKSNVRKGDTAPPPPPLIKKSGTRKGDTAPPPPPLPVK